MRLTSDGNNASLVYFTMAEFCNWSKDPDSKLYDKDYYPSFEPIGLGLFNWKERPFSEIYDRIKDMKKVTFVNIPNEPSEYDTSTSKHVMCFFK